VSGLKPPFCPPNGPFKREAVLRYDDMTVGLSDALHREDTRIEGDVQSHNRLTIERFHSMDDLCMSCRIVV